MHVKIYLHTSLVDISTARSECGNINTSRTLLFYIEHTYGARLQFIREQKLLHDSLNIYLFIVALHNYILAGNWYFFFYSTEWMTGGKSFSSVFTDYSSKKPPTRFYAYTEFSVYSHIFRWVNVKIFTFLLVLVIEIIGTYVVTFHNNVKMNFG